MAMKRVMGIISLGLANFADPRMRMSLVKRMLNVWIRNAVMVDRRVLCLRFVSGEVMQVQHVQILWIATVATVLISPISLFDIEVVTIPTQLQRALGIRQQIQEIGRIA